MWLHWTDTLNFFFRLHELHLITSAGSTSCFFCDNNFLIFVSNVWWCVPASYESANAGFLLRRWKMMYKLIINVFLMVAVLLFFEDPWILFLVHLCVLLLIAWQYFTVELPVITVIVPFVVDLWSLIRRIILCLLFITKMPTLLAYLLGTRIPVDTMLFEFHYFEMACCQFCKGCCVFTSTYFRG